MRRLICLVATIAAAALMAGTAHAGPGGQLRIEKAWYNGHEVTFLQPSVFSANPNGGVLACFGLGPDISTIDRPTQPLYVIFDGSATQDHCDGQPDVLRHDGLLRTSKTKQQPVKILGNGDAPKGVTIHAHAFTRSALEKLEAAGSTAQRISWPDGLPVDEQAEAQEAAAAESEAEEKAALRAAKAEAKAEAAEAAGTAEAAAPEPPADTAEAAAEADADAAPDEAQNDTAAADGTADGSDS